MSTKRFRIALSFAGEKRNFVAEVASILAQRFGEPAILYDKYHEAEFARYDLGIYLPKLYRKQSDLVVAVLCPEYDEKVWTGWEWIAIYGQLTKKEGSKIMLCRFRQAEVDGLFDPAAFVELDDKTPEQAAALILQRLALNEGKPKDHYAAASTASPAPPSTTIPNNLPRLQPFFGREAELANIRSALDPASRTWGTLIDGDGGKGKTALANRAAYECPPAHFNRIVFVSMKQQEQDDNKLRQLEGFALSSWMQMLNEIARVLDLPEVAKASENERARVLRDKLDGRRVLLVLDNLETLSDPEQDQLFTFLEYLPSDCKALLTSRIFAGNKLLAIKLPKLDQTSALEMLAEIAEHNPSFGKSTEADRIQLYEQTQGNALLLRWVAGQVGSGHCTKLSDALDHLGACPVGNDPLAYIFADVVDSLGDQENKLLAALTWPNQPIPVEALGEIGDVPLADARRRLKLLTNRSLVVPDPEEKQYALVPMVADFLRKHRPEVVRETGDRLEQRAYALIVENGDRKHDRFPILDAAWPTVAPALPLFLAGLNPKLQTVCSALDTFLNFTGRWDEWISISQQAEAKATEVNDFENAGLRAYQGGWIHYLRMQADAVLTCADRATAHWHAAKAGPGILAVAIQLRGFGHRSNGDFAAAIMAYREALDLFRSSSPESAEVASDLNSLADAERLSGDFPAAERDYDEALRVALAVGDAQGVAICTGNLALLALDRKDWPAAETVARKALLLAEKVGRQELIAADCDCLAKALLRQNKAADALPYVRRAVEIFTRLGSPRLSYAQATLAVCDEARPR